MSSYSLLENPHSVVHDGTKKILHALEAGEYDLTQFIKAIDEMETGSEGVFSSLDKILNEKS